MGHKKTGQPLADTARTTRKHMNDMDRARIKRRIKHLGQQYAGIMCRTGLGVTLATELNQDACQLSREIAWLQKQLDEDKGEDDD